MTANPVNSTINRRVDFASAENMTKLLPRKDFPDSRRYAGATERRRDSGTRAGTRRREATGRVVESVGRTEKYRLLGVF
jgi:hypothetical protein